MGRSSIIIAELGPIKLHMDQRKLLLCWSKWPQLLTLFVKTEGVCNSVPYIVAFWLMQFICKVQHKIPLESLVASATVMLRSYCRYRLFRWEADSSTRLFITVTVVISTGSCTTVTRKPSENRTMGNVGWTANENFCCIGSISMADGSKFPWLSLQCKYRTLCYSLCNPQFIQWDEEKF